MPLEKVIYPGDKIIMFVNYPDGKVVNRYFDHPRVLDAWVKTMKTLKALSVIDGFSLFEVAEFPPHAVVTH